MKPIETCEDIFSVLFTFFTFMTSHSCCKAEFEETNQTEVQKDLSNAPNPRVVRKFVVDILQIGGIADFSAENTDSFTDMADVHDVHRTKDI